MAAPKETPDYYTLLSVPNDASSDEIRKAFHRFARQYHPDNFGPDEAEPRERASALYRLGTEAYRILLDSAKRRLYDEGLAKGQMRYTVDRAEEFRRTRPGGRRSIMKSRKARTFYARAKQAMRGEDWATAKLNLKLALQHEPENEELKKKLDEVLGYLRKG